MLQSLLGIARQWSREKFAILSLKPRSHVRILLIEGGLLSRPTFRCLCFSKYSLKEIIDVEENHDVMQGDRYLIDVVSEC